MFISALNLALLKEVIIFGSLAVTIFEVLAFSRQ